MTMRDRYHLLIPLALLTQACTGDDTSAGTPDSGGGDVAQSETGVPDAGATQDSAADTSPAETSTNDSGSGDASAADASDASCPSGWQTTPTVASGISVPADGGSVLLHASAAGTQNYTCGQIADGGYAWVFVGPQADLMDCNAALIGHHFASDGGAAAPEWQTLDGTYVVGHKVAAFTPDAGPPAVPWLLLQATAHGGTGTLNQAAYVQRLFTDGGVAPTTTCDQTVAGGSQSSDKVPYTADYYFYGP
jgi:hypothetical protein